MWMWVGQWNITGELWHQSFVFKWELKNNFIYSSEHFGHILDFFLRLNRRPLLSFLKYNLVRISKTSIAILLRNQSLELQEKPLPQSIPESTAKFNFQPMKCVWRHQPPNCVTCTRGTLEKASFKTQECNQGREQFKWKHIHHQTMGTQQNPLPTPTDSGKKSTFIQIAKHSRVNIIPSLVCCYYTVQKPRNIHQGAHQLSSRFLKTFSQCRKRFAFFSSFLLPGAE